MWTAGIGTAVGSSNQDTRLYRHPRSEVSQEKWQCAVGGFFWPIESTQNSSSSIVAKVFRDYDEGRAMSENKSFTTLPFMMRGQHLKVA